MVEFIRTREPKTARIRKALEHPVSIRAERCRRSFFYFIQEFWDTVSPDVPHWNWHIPYIADELQKVAERAAQWKPRKQDVIINVPPGTTKSTTCTIMFPDWCWIRWPWMRFITASYSGALSLEHAEYSRNLIRSDKFRAYFPDLSIKADKDTKSNFRIVRTLPDGRVEVGGNRFSTSVGGTLTGYHGHLLIVDDPIDPNRAVSTVELRKANNWMDQTLSTRKVDKQVVPTVLIMQRLHENDPAGHILSKKKKTKHICIPGEIRSPGYQERVNPPELVKYYQEGLMDSVRLPEDVLEDMEDTLGQYGYAGQIGQYPVPPGGAMFSVDNFQIIDTLPSETNFLGFVRYWDKAGTEGAGANTAGVKMIRLKSGRFIVADVKLGQWASDKREDIIRQTAEADGKHVSVYVEQEPGSGGKESAESTIRNLAGFSVFADRPTGDKVFRADPYSVQVNKGNVWLLRGEWNRAFIEEHRFFPFGTKKDQVDASSGAFTKLTNRKVARVIG